MNMKTNIIRRGIQSRRGGLLKLAMTFSLTVVGLGGYASAQDQTQQDQGQQDQTQQDQGQQDQGGGNFGGGGFQGQGGGRRNRQLQADNTGGDLSNGNGNFGNGGGRRGGRRGGGGGGGGFGRQQGGFGYNNNGGGYTSGYNSNRALTGDGYADQYGLISDHNIFQSDRRPVPPRSTGGLALTPEQSWVLNGIVLEDNEYHAYAENVGLPGSPPTRLRVNDPIARGKVAEITIDQLAYEHDGEKTWVTVGSNLTGTQPVAGTRLSALPSDGGSGGFTGVNNGALNTANNRTYTGNNNNNGGFGNGGFGNNGLNNTNNNNFVGGRGGGGGRRGGGFAATPAVAPPPLPGGDAANMSLEERMRLRRQADLGVLPSAAVPPGVAEPTPAPVPDAAQTAPAAPIVPNAGNLSPEEQMRLRRQQQLGGQ